METKQAYQDKLKAQLDKLDAKIDEMKAKAAQAKAESQIQYNEQLVTISAKRDDVGQKLQKLQASSSEAWEDLKNGIDRAWIELQTAFDKAKTKF